MPCLWLLSEERPKKEVVSSVVEKVAESKRLRFCPGDTVVSPIFKDGKFKFLYKVEGPTLETVDRIFLAISEGGGSFVDYLAFISDSPPSQTDTPLLALEETKTSGAESRNTGVYQRCSKFVYIDLFYPGIKKIMLYNIHGESDSDEPMTIIFGTRMLLTIGVNVVGKDLDPKVFMPFANIDELIEFKKSMRAPPAKSNVPIEITKRSDRIEISGRLVKNGRLSHDPNIGALTLISMTLRALGWKGRIIITRHGLERNLVNPGNKFVDIANQIGIELDGITMPSSTPSNWYWRYSSKSEKLATILLHLMCERVQHASVIYENHAGSELGYFLSKSGEPKVVHKYIKNDKRRGSIYHPDVIIADHKRKQIVIVEGKRKEKVAEGIDALNKAEPLVKEYIEPEYPGYTVGKGIALFGGTIVKRNTVGGTKVMVDPHVIFWLASDGTVLTTDQTPPVIKDAVDAVQSGSGGPDIDFDLPK